MITVVNLKYDKRPSIVYIGRQMPGRPASPLANPFKASKDYDPIERYRRWLWEQLRTDTPQRREMDHLVKMHRAGQHIRLGCWCAPAPCHGAVVKAAIEWLAVDTGPATPRATAVDGSVIYPPTWIVGNKNECSQTT
jgi:Domain of unknown function (DUF4326)